MAEQRNDMLSIYLNDHFAGSVGGVDLARRTAKAQRGTDRGPTLQRLAAEIAEDRTSLVDMMGALGIPTRRYKAVGAWLVEKAGRLKPNGHLLSRSPLSSLVELEALMMGVEGKGAAWRTLRAVAEQDTRLDAARLDELIARAQAQEDTLEELRMRAVTEAFKVG